MTEKTTVQINSDLYQKLADLVGARHIAEFLESLALDALSRQDRLTAEEVVRGYQAMAADEESEKEAHEWCEALVGDGFRNCDPDR